MSNLKVHPMIIFFLFLSLLPNLITAKTPHSHLQVTRYECQGAPYPNLCVSTLASFTGLASMSLPEINSATLHHSSPEVRSASTHCTVMKNHLLAKLSMLEWQAFDVCLELFHNILNDFDHAVSYLEGSKVTRHHYYNLQSLLSGMMANVYMCTDEFL